MGCGGWRRCWWQSWSVEDGEGVGGSHGVCVGDINDGDEVGRCGRGSDIGSEGTDYGRELHISWVEMAEVVMVVRG